LVELKMKVLWVEDHALAVDRLNAAAAAASRRRFGIDLVIATTLLEAERRLRLERFDLVVTDLLLPGAIDEYATVTRLSSMGRFRIAIASDSQKREEVMRSLVRAGVDCAPTAIGKGGLALADFVRRPELLRDFLDGLMSDTRSRAAAG